MVAKVVDPGVLKTGLSEPGYNGESHRALAAERHKIKRQLLPARRL
jgi:hypothetical protein